MSDALIRDLERRAAEGDLAARDRLALEQSRRGRDEQRDALALMLSGKNVFLTGPGGTGKSWVVRRFLEECRKVRRHVLVAATTGVAAVALGGSTLHRTVGLPVLRVRKTREEAASDWGEDGEQAAETFDDAAEEARVRPSAVVLQSYKQPWQRFTATRLRMGFRPDRQDDSSVGAGAIVIDEVSMCDAFMFDAASWLCATARRTDAPFGGLQVVVVGDLGQLPPVDERFGWAHESAAWKGLDPVVCSLTQPRRQSDPEFAALLARIRLGELTPHDQKILSARVHAFDPATAPQAVRIMSTNRECGQINEAELQKIPGPVRTRVAAEEGPAAILADIDRGCPSPRVLRLKVGARVLLTANDPYDPPAWANGTAGTVREIGVEVVDAVSGETLVGVAVEDDRGQEILATPVRWEVRELRDGVDTVVAWREQLPLRLGWAITAHRSQGATLDRASVSLEHAFASGQAYTALSRVRTLEGLNLESARCGNLTAHPKFLSFERQRKPWGGLVA